MTDSPPGTGGPGDDPEPYVPSGVRRSTFTPAEDAGDDDTAYDDDALAAAMAAEVAAYTSPVSIIPPVDPIPSQAEAAAPAPAEVDEPAPADIDEPSIPTPTLETSLSPTLEAIERLESELRRRAEETRVETEPPPTEQPATELPPMDPPVGPAATAPPPGSPLFPAPPTFLRPAPPEEFSWLPPSVAGEAPAEPTAEEPVTEQPRAEESPAAEPPPAWGPAEESPAAEPPPAWGPVEEPVETAEPPAWGPSTFGSLPPPLVEPPFLAPPPLVDPPSPSTGSLAMAPPPEPASVPSAFDAPPTSAPIDLPPPATVDFAQLPPPVGLEPAPIPPYDPSTDRAQRTGELGPLPGNFQALLATGSTPPPHPDDLGPPPFEPPTAPPETGESAPKTWAQSPDEDDDVDDVDRAFGTGAIAIDSTGSVHVIAPPSEPIPTTRLADGEPALVDEHPESHPALLVETAGPEPTALDLRAGRAARLFWLWFAANSSIVSLSLGAVLFGLGMSLRQTLVAILLGVALSFLPLGLVTLAGKWSGQPTMIVSRATFGIVGNGLPAVVALVSRVFWGGALLWLLAAGVARVLVDAGLDAGLGEFLWTLVGLGVGFALAFVVAVFGYGLIARVQLVLSILTGLLVVGVVVLTFPRLDVAAAQGVDDGPWTLLVTGIVLVFSFVGLAWVHSSADVARYQRTESDGGSTMLWATFGATLPAFILVAWGALLAASDPLIADGLATNPLYTIAALLPLWYPAPLIAAVALGLLSGVVLTIYSGGFALQSLGVRARRSITTVIAGGLVLAAAVALLFLAGDARGLIVDVATTVAVPVAAWASIFGAEIMIRRRGFDAESLLSRGGIYPAARWVNLLGLVAISAIGFGLTSAELAGLDWQGYLFPLIGFADGDPLLTSDVGVLVALVLGLVLPLATAVPAIRRQERTLVD